MRKRNLILSFTFIFLFLFISSFLYFYYFHYLIKLKYFTDIPELYSSFTDYMRNEVDSHLKLLNCQPKEYYYDGSNICFICSETHPCFGFGWVDRGKEGKKINPKGIPYLVKWREFNVRVGDFCLNGLASEFSCKKANKNILECENIRLLSVNKNGVFNCNNIKIMIKEDEDFKNFADSFCRIKKGEIKYETESLAFCGRYIIELEENREIIIGKK